MNNPRFNFNFQRAYFVKKILLDEQFFCTLFVLFFVEFIYLAIAKKNTNNEF